MDLFKNNERLSASSKKLYAHNLKKLNDNEPVNNLNFLKHYGVIDAKLEKISPNTRRSYIIAIVSATKGIDRLSKVNKYYYDKMLLINKQLKDQTNKTNNESENWLSQTEINEKFDELYSIVSEVKNKRKINDTKYTALLDCLLLGLYVLNPPRRNLDYCMMVVDQPTETNDYNFYYKDKFYFNHYKTAKTYDQQIVDVPEKLNGLIKLYLKFKTKDNRHLLINYKGRALDTGTDITRRLMKIFDGKKISSSMLRKIYLTDKYSEVMDELDQDVAKMGTSVSTAQHNYIKDE